MKQLLITYLALFSINAIAQTKKIAFKSHSGSMENFPVALEKALFDMDGSNFGQAPTRTIRTAQLDSVIFISDSLAVLVTSEVCKTKNNYNKKEASDAKVWSAGRETVVMHPLFSKKHALDSIKKVIKTQYNFQNEIEKVVFVGYDNKKKKAKKATVIPFYGNNNTNGFDFKLTFAIALIALLSLVTAILVKQYYRFKEKSVHQPSLISA